MKQERAAALMWLGASRGDMELSARENLVVDSVVADPEPLQHTVLFLREGTVMNANRDRVERPPTFLDVHHMIAETRIARICLEGAIGISRL